jgi:hypothetical protein
MTDVGLPGDIDWNYIATLRKVQEQFPGYWQFLIAHPDILRIYVDAITNPTAWPPERLDAQVANTNWFQNTPASSREWEILQATDPATARQMAVDTFNLVNDIGTNLGISFDGFMGVEFVDLAIRNQWDANEIRYHMLQSVNKKYGGGGEVAYAAARAKSIAESYGIPMSDDQAMMNGMKLAQGVITEQALTGSMMTMAQGLYPSLAPILERGMTIRQYAEPYVQLAVQELGINPNAVDLTNPAWMELFVGSNADGNQAVSTMGEALRKLRSDPRYGYDTGLPGRTAAASFQTEILKRFGAIG